MLFTSISKFMMRDVDVSSSRRNKFPWCCHRHVSARDDVVLPNAKYEERSTKFEDGACLNEYVDIAGLDLSTI